jgi:hypothetical protein
MFKVHALYMTPKNVCQKATHVKQNASRSGDQGSKNGNLSENLSPPVTKTIKISRFIAQK